MTIAYVNSVTPQFVDDLNTNFNGLANALNSLATYGGITTALGFPPRPTLSATQWIYVRTDGNDSNTGLVDSPSGAFATWQAAVNLAQSYDFNGETLNIKAGEQGSPQVWNLSQPVVIENMVGFGLLQILPSSSGTTVNGVNGAFSLNNTLVNVVMGGLTLTTTGTGYGTVTVGGHSIYQHATIGPNYGATGTGMSDVYIHDAQASAAILNNTYSITAGKQSHIAGALGAYIALEGCTINHPNAIVFTTGYIDCRGGHIQSTGCTFSNAGNVTGPRYSVSLGGVLNTLGNGANYFPGDSGGGVSSWGSYTDTVDTTQYWFRAGVLSGGAITIGSAAPTLNLQKNASGQSNVINGSTAGIVRWQIVPGNATAESGSNVGSDCAFAAFSDGGAFLGFPLILQRSTLNAIFGGTIFSGSVLCNTSGGMGYVNGAGGAVTQATNKTTLVTLNTVCGQITTAASSLSGGASATFIVLNSKIGGSDTVVANISGGGTADAYRVDVTNVAGGGFHLTLTNITGGPLSEQPIINFSIVKAVTS